MYRPPFNDWTDRDAMVAFCNAHPFALFISTDLHEKRPVATHIPAMVREVDGELVCTLHIAKANAQWKGLEDEVLLVFSGPHAYISPSGYTQIDVPTWNYIAVHVYGVAQIISDSDEVRSRLKLLVDEHDHSELWKQLQDANEVDPLLNGIVMIDVRVTDMQGKRKLSQNRNEHDRAYGERLVIPPSQA